jgi:hypothetical protein
MGRGGLYKHFVELRVVLLAGRSIDFGIFGIFCPLMMSIMRILSIR